MNKSLMSLIIGLFVTACAPLQNAMISMPTAEIANTAMPTMTMTVTFEPTPTIGYQSTAEAAQLTAEAAERLNVAVTAEYEQRVHQEIAWTAESELRRQEVLSWTATAALTTIPLTATQQAALNTQIPIQQALMAGQLTSTQGAPTLMVAMRDAELAVKWAPAKVIGVLFMSFSAGLFFLVCCWMIYLDDKRKRERERTAKKDRSDEAELPIIHPIDLNTIVDVRRDNGGGYTATARMVVPCSPDQLTEFADAVLSGVKTLAFKHWEEKGSLGRRTYANVRNFLQTNHFAVSDGSAVLALTEDGRAFLREWLNTRALPHSYEFDPESQENHAENAHEYENHDHDHAVEEVKRQEMSIISETDFSFTR